MSKRKRRATVGRLFAWIVVTVCLLASHAHVVSAQIPGDRTPAPGVIAFSPLGLLTLMQWSLCVGAVCAIWVAAESRRRDQRRGWWVLGTLLAAPVVLPWYVALLPRVPGAARGVGQRWIVALTFLGTWGVTSGLFAAWRQTTSRADDAHFSLPGDNWILSALASSISAPTCWRIWLVGMLAGLIFILGARRQGGPSASARDPA